MLIKFDLVLSCTSWSLMKTLTTVNDAPAADPMEAKSKIKKMIWFVFTNHSGTRFIRSVECMQVIGTYSRMHMQRLD